MQIISKIMEQARLVQNKLNTCIYSMLTTSAGALVLLLGSAEIAAASGGLSGGPSLITIATSITSSFGALAKLITAGSYICGMGFALSSILKFKQHKDNPTQIPIGTPIALLFIAAALIFLPTIFGVANQTLFGNTGQAGGVTGVST